MKSNCIFDDLDDMKHGSTKKAATSELNRDSESPTSLRDDSRVYKALLAWSGGYLLRANPSESQFLVKAQEQAFKLWVGLMPDLPTKKNIHDIAKKLQGALLDQGYLSDTRLACLRIRELQSQGSSRQLIEQKLRVKGLRPETIQDAFERLQTELHSEQEAPEDDSLLEWQSLLRYAAKRRLGFFEHSGKPRFSYKVSYVEQQQAEPNLDLESTLSAVEQQKVLKKLAQRGFTFDLAHRFIQLSYATFLEEKQKFFD